MVTITPVRAGTVSVLTVSGEIDLTSGPRLRAALDEILDERGARAPKGIVVDLRRNVLGFYNQPEESVALFKRHGAALMYANYGAQQLLLLKAQGVDAGYVIPREGALPWISAGACAATCAVQYGRALELGAPGRAPLLARVLREQGRHRPGRLRAAY